MLFLPIWGFIQSLSIHQQQQRVMQSQQQTVMSIHSFEILKMNALFVYIQYMISHSALFNALLWLQLLYLTSLNKLLSLH